MRPGYGRAKAGSDTIAGVVVVRRRAREGRPPSWLTARSKRGNRAGCTGRGSGGPDDERCRPSGRIAAAIATRSRGRREPGVGEVAAPRARRSLLQSWYPGGQTVAVSISPSTASTRPAMRTRSTVSVFTRARPHDQEVLQTRPRGDIEGTTQPIWPRSNRSQGRRAMDVTAYATHAAGRKSANESDTAGGNASP